MALSLNRTEIQGEARLGAEVEDHLSRPERQTQNRWTERQEANPEMTPRKNFALWDAEATMGGLKVCNTLLMT